MLDDGVTLELEYSIPLITVLVANMQIDHPPPEKSPETSHFSLDMYATEKKRTKKSVQIDENYDRN